MAEISEDRLDLLEEKLRAKVDTMTGFSDVEAKSRALEKVFKYFDVERTGRLDYGQFFAAMTRLNFVGVQRELESLFDRYDEQLCNTIDYRMFCAHLFQMGERIAMNTTSRSMVERFKAQIFQRGGVTGLRSLRAHLESLNRDGSGLLERSELIQGLINFGIAADDGPGGDVEKIMGFFDRDAVGRISIREFHRGLRGNMPKQRQLVVKEAYERMLSHYGGFVTIEDVRRSYDPMANPDVARGRMSPEDACHDLLMSIRREGSCEQADVHFSDFLDYFRDISAGIENDENFREVVLNAWVMPAQEDRGIANDNGSADGNQWGTGDNRRRALVTHPDGVQEVLMIENARDIGPDSHDLMRKRLEEQGVQEIASVSLVE